MTKYTILSIDDNKNNLFTLNALLSTLQDIKQYEALNAKEALDILLTKKIDLILCDVQMPDINGFELAQMIKSNSRTKEIPIIFVTAVFKAEEFIKQGFALGAVDYITKPIDDNQLLNKLKLYLNIFEQKSSAFEQEKRFCDIVQSLNDGVYTLDINHKTTFINKKALSLLGFTKKQLIDVPIHDYIRYKDINNKPLSHKDCKILNTMQTQEVYKSKNEAFVKKDGSLIKVSLRVTPLYYEDIVSGCIVVFKERE